MVSVISYTEIPSDSEIEIIATIRAKQQEQLTNVPENQFAGFEFD